MPIHPITGGFIEDGHGALSEIVQATRHCDEAEASGLVERADEWRKKLGLQTSVDRKAAERAVAKERAEKVEREKAAAAVLPKVEELEAKHAEHHDRLTELEENAAEHKAMADRIKKLEEAIAELQHDKGHE